MKPNIVIIGMPGSGKTTFGSKLAEKLGLIFFDADAYLEEMQSESIQELFAVSEDFFRCVETESLRGLSAKKGVVIATGGGAVKREENMAILRKSGITIFIDRAPDDIVKDVDIVSRPLLAKGRQEIYALYNERIGLYREYADYCAINDSEISVVLERICRYLMAEGYTTKSTLD